MNYSHIILALILSFYSIGCLSKDKETLLSERSEEYNLHYLYHQNFSQSFMKDTIVYIDKELPNSFVIELGGLKNGQKSVLVYNDNQELLITKNNGRYIIDGNTMDLPTNNDYKLSLYVISGKVFIYADEKKIGDLSHNIDPSKRIGVKFVKNDSLSYDYLCCYELCEFKEIDYGKQLDTGVLTRTPKLLSSQGVSEIYSLTLPQDITCNSPRSIRFEYRFEDSKKEGKTKTQKGRSEISGVQSSSIMGKWIIEFDFLIPQETSDDYKYKEIITQLHEGSMDAISPAFCIGMWKGKLYCRLRGDSIPIGQWEKRNKPINGTYIKRLGYLEKNKWHHIKIFIREAYQRSMNPLTVIWVDSVKVFESNHPNCYNYEPRRKDLYNYIKFGIYKSSWLKLKACRTETARRIYYFDNYKVKY